MMRKKKRIVLLSCILMVLELTGCGKQMNTEQAVGSGIQQNNETMQDAASQQTDNTAESLIPEVFQLALPPFDNPICIHAPAWKEIEKGRTEIFHVKDVSVVSITYTAEKFTTIEEAHGALWEDYKTASHNYTLVYSQNITSEKVENINGIEAYHYEGTIGYGDRMKPRYLTGYTFIYDGVPISINGVVVYESQSEALINEVRTIVDGMVKSVRREKDKK